MCCIPVNFFYALLMSHLKLEYCTLLEFVLLKAIFKYPVNLIVPRFYPIRNKESKNETG